MFLNCGVLGSPELGGRGRRRGETQTRPLAVRIRLSIFWVLGFRGSLEFRVEGL